MEKKKDNAGKIILKPDKEKKPEPDGYPSYPEKEDIYNKNRKEQDINEEDLSKIKSPNENNRSAPENEKDYSEDESGTDLDVPGAELDDEQELTGNEDEENNYYSLGGDDHNNLDEAKE